MEGEPLLVLIEYHSAEAPWVGATKQIKRASLYITKGLAADDVYGISYMDRAGAPYLCIAQRIAKKDAEELVDILVAEFSKRGLRVESGSFCDE